MVGRDGSGYAGDLGGCETEIFFAMGLDRPKHTKSSPSGVGVFVCDVIHPAPRCHCEERSDEAIHSLLYRVSFTAAAHRIASLRSQ
jgi:hypothetical protein